MKKRTEAATYSASETNVTNCKLGRLAGRLAGPPSWQLPDAACQSPKFCLLAPIEACRFRDDLVYFTNPADAEDSLPLTAAQPC